MKLLPGLSADLRRGMLLVQQARYRDAEVYFRRVLENAPEDPRALHHLAFTLLYQDGRAKEAMVVGKKAVAAEPENPEHRALLAFILNKLDRTTEALDAAKVAAEAAPESAFIFTAWAQGYIQQHRWAQAEEKAREALRLDPENSLAANQLALALRQQNRMTESAEQLRGMLARDPEDPMTHSSAGWTALQLGDQPDAESHFLEALRLDPDNATAREGLMSSYRSRTPFYRSYLKYCFAMNRLTGRVQISIVLGVFLVYLWVQKSAMMANSFTGGIIGLAYFLIMLWFWVAEAVGNFFILCDKNARHSLRKSEKLEAMLIGGGVLTGLGLVALGLGTMWVVVYISGLTLLWSAIPFSLVITNPSRLGRAIFLTLGIISFVSGWTIIAVFTGLPEEYRVYIPSLMLVVAISALGSTWLGNIPALRRPHVQ